MLFFEYDDYKSNDVNPKIKKMTLQQFIDYIENNPEHEKELHEIGDLDRNILFFVDDLDKIKYLIEVKGVNVNQVSEYGRNPMFFGKADVVEFYYSKGVDINAIDDDNNSVYTFADLDTSKKLLELGLDLNENLISALFNHHSSFIDETTYDKYNLLFDYGFKLPETISHYELCRNKKLFIDVLDRGYTIKEDEYHDFFTRIIAEKIDTLSILLERVINTKEKKDITFNNLVKNINRYNSPSEYIEAAEKHLDIDLHNHKINSIPWFLQYKVDYSFIKLMNKKKINYLGVDDDGKSIIFHRNSFNEIKLTLGDHFESLKKKDKFGKTFAEYMNGDKLADFIDEVYDDYIQKNYESKDLHNYLRKKVLVPLYAKGKLDLDINKIKNYKEEFQEDFIEYEKKNLVKELAKVKNTKIPVEIKNKKRI